MSRRLARQLTLQTLFQMEFSDTTFLEALELAKNECNEKNITRSEAYAKILLEEISLNKKQIDDKISSYTKDWHIDRLAFVDLNILRIAICEMFFIKDKIKPNIAINEAVEIAKLYGDDNTPRFINGILGNLVKTTDFEIGQ